MAFVKLIVAAMAAMSLVQSVRVDEDEENGCILWGKCCTVKCNGLHHDVGSAFSMNLNLYNCQVQEGEYKEGRWMKQDPRGPTEWVMTVMKPEKLNRGLKKGDYACKETCKVTYNDGSKGKVDVFRSGGDTQSPAKCMYKNH
eukprot:symbB.v1.2.023379.t1/scaffold2091.1/size89877/3